MPVGSTQILVVDPLARWNLLAMIQSHSLHRSVSMLGNYEILAISVAGAHYP